MIFWGKFWQQETKRKKSFFFRFRPQMSILWENVSAQYDKVWQKLPKIAIFWKKVKVYTFTYLTFWPSFLLICGQKAHKIDVFQKMLIYGRKRKKNDFFHFFFFIKIFPKKPLGAARIVFWTFFWPPSFAKVIICRGQSFTQTRLFSKNVHLSAETKNKHDFF